MTDNEKMTLMEKVLGDSAVIEKVIDAESMEEAKGILAANGLELTDEEMGELGKALDAAVSGNGELSEDQLEDVAGGASLLSTIWNLLRKLPLSPISPSRPYRPTRRW